MILVEDLLIFRIRSITKSCTSLLSHLDSAVWHESSFQRLICLQSDDLLQVFQLIFNICCIVSCKAGNDLCLLIENAVVVVLCLLQFLYLVPKFVSCFCRSCKERLVAVVLCVVLLDEVTYVTFLFPDTAFETVPSIGLEHTHVKFTSHILTS